MTSILPNIMGTFVSVSYLPLSNNIRCSQSLNESLFSHYKSGFPLLLLRLLILTLLLFPLPLLDMQMLDFLRYQRTLSFHFFLKEFHLLTRLCTDNSQIYILSTDLFWELQSYIIGTATSISQNTSNWTCLKLICYFLHLEMFILP